MSQATPPDVLWLDGMPDEAVVLPSGQPRKALGCDPFAADPAPDPFSERLEARGPAPEPAEPGRSHLSPGWRTLQERSSSTELPHSSSNEAQRPSSTEALHSIAAEALRSTSAESPDLAPRDARAPEPASARRRAWSQTPRIDEVELPDRATFTEQFLSEDVRRRLAALTHLVEGGAPYDRYGFSPVTAQSSFPLFHALYRYYFRVESLGHANLPEEGPAVLASNHGGLLPFDGAMTVVDVLLNTNPPRLPRAVVDRWAGRLPWVNVFYARVGQVIGTRENVDDLLDDGQLVLVFPEGMAGVRKRITQRYRAQHFRVGFVEAALKAGAPIVPMAVVGSDDQAPILYDFEGLAKRLGLPFFPLTPTFPLLGPLGLLPYPVGYRIVYGEPLQFHERFGPEGAEDPRLVRYLANQVRREVQLLLDRNRR